VACPFFKPLGPLEQGPWERPPRLPLGDPYYGDCLANPSDPFAATESSQRELCNCGYARGRCEHFPDNSAGDAVRFSISDDARGRLQMVYVIEKDHVPIEHGPLEYAIERAAFAESQISAALETQASAFVMSYLRRRVPVE
jgi:hypothetical protein